MLLTFNFATQAQPLILPKDCQNEHLMQFCVDDPKDLIIHDMA